MAIDGNGLTNMEVAKNERSIAAYEISNLIKWSFFLTIKSAKNSISAKFHNGLGTEPKNGFKKIMILKSKSDIGKYFLLFFKPTTINTTASTKTYASFNTANNAKLIKNKKVYL